jgi:hypothetical protein
MRVTALSPKGPRRRMIASCAMITIFNKENPDLSFLGMAYTNN